MAEPIVLLHGDLDLYIHEVRNLPNMDIFTDRLSRCFSFSSCSSSPSPSPSPHVQSTRLPLPSPIITSDPYVTLLIFPDGPTVARTVLLSNTQSPKWAHHFPSLPLAHWASHLQFHVKDNDFLGSQLIGTASIPANSLLSGPPLTKKWVPILGASSKPSSALLISLNFTPLGPTPPPRVIPAYFAERTHGDVTLYQDAHVSGHDLPRIETEGGSFRHQRCWEDMCHAILDVHKLIYIVGWSIYDKVRLVREQTRELPEGGELTLGDLFKLKS